MQILLLPKKTGELLNSYMRRWFSILTVVLFFIWILPLGAFIKPSQETLACNGRRAVCQCSHLIGKPAQNQIGVVAFKAAASGVNENGNGSASVFQLVPEAFTLPARLILEEPLSETRFAYRHIFSCPLDKVPKA